MSFSSWMDKCYKTVVHCPSRHSVQFSHSVVSDSLWPHELWHTSLPVLHHLLEFAQIHVHWISDAIQPSHPHLSPSPPAFNLSQHQGLFQCVSSSHQVAKVLELHLQHQSFQWTIRVDFLALGGCHLTVCSCELFMILQREGDREQALWCLFHKGINPILGGPTLMTSSNPNYFPKDHLQIPFHWRLGLQHMNVVWRVTNIQSITRA